MGEVKVGQVYKDNDRRYQGRAVDRHVVVKGFINSSGKPTYVLCDVRFGGADAKWQTRIRQDRLTSRRFKLVQDA